mmetsp:Transcript_31244/g.75201  ORF Transcript_31244/g.75201 Transcript_31244/m.75201 type:complete len:88 (+) Transcript_31244:492-755(+)
MMLHDQKIKGAVWVHNEAISIVSTPLFDSPLFQKTPLPNSRVKGAPPPPMPAQVGANGNSKTNNEEEGISKDDASRPKNQRCRLGSQ